MATLEEHPQEVVSVGTADGQVEAEIIKGLLNANGVEVWLSQESAGPAIGLGIGPMAEVEIMVRVEQAEQARALLEGGPEADPDN
ncbi:MAG: putative signal transducing protein [Anaerolineales bacterium]